MPKRRFVYRSGGVTEVTPEENLALCAELTADAAERIEPLEYGVPRNNPEWRNVSGKWPVHSDSMACESPEQAKIEQAELRKHGVTTDYDSDNRPIWRDRAHKKAHQIAIGNISGVPWYDGDAGYGDATPNNVDTSLKRRKMRSLDEIYAERREKMAEMNRVIRSMGG